MLDAFAGLYTEKELVDRLRKAMEVEETVSMAHLDIDGFAQMNDQYGYEAGDRLLVAVAGVLREMGEPHGWLLCRVTGDEFLVAMPGLALERAFLQMDELRRRIGAAIGPLAPDMKMSVSLGVANYPRDAKDYRTLLRKADHALYQAKEAGRDQVSLAWSEEMTLKSCYYSNAQLSRLKRLAEQVKRKESVLMREALDDLLRKYDRPAVSE